MDPLNYFMTVGFTWQNERRSPVMLLTQRRRQFSASRLRSWSAEVEALFLMRTTKVVSPLTKLMAKSQQESLRNFEPVLHRIGSG